MAIVFTIIMLFSLVIFVIFGIKALLALNKKKNVKDMGKKTLYAFVVAVAALAGVAVTAPDVEDSNELAVSNMGGDIEKVESDNATVNNDLTVDAYAQRLAKVFKEMGSKTNLQVISVDEQSDGTSKILLSADTYIIANAPDGIVNQLSLHIDPAANYESNEDFKFAYLLLVGTADPTLSMGKRNLLLRELALDNKKTFEKKNKSIVAVGTITFSFDGNPKKEYTLNATW